jgi:integrase
MIAMPHEPAGQNESNELPAMPALEERDLQTERDRLLQIQDRLLQEKARLHEAAQAANAAARQNIFTRSRRRKSPHTVRLHYAALKCFMTCLEEFGIPLSFHLAEEPKLWEAIDFGLVEAFQDWMGIRGYTIKTMNDYLGVVKRYAGLAHQAKMMTLETLTAIKEIKAIAGKEAEHLLREREGMEPLGAKKPAATYLTPEELQRLFALPDTPQGQRDRVALTLLYELGLRPGEAVALRFSDLHLDEGYIHVYRLKTYEHQEIELSEEFQAVLQAYLAIRRDWTAYCAAATPGSNAPVLVQTLKNGQLVEQLDMDQKVGDKRYRRGKQARGTSTPSADWSTQSMYTYIHKLSIKLGLPPLASYDGRHQFAYDAARSGTNYIDLLQAGGWKPGSRMPDRYYGRHRVSRSGVKLTVRKTGTEPPAGDGQKD